MPDFKLEDRASTYHVTVPHFENGKARGFDYKRVSAFGFEIKDGCLIFYWADGANLAYAPGHWLKVCKE